jgi:drug/metabolite transporter (DMT)-like permease
MEMLSGAAALICLATLAGEWEKLNVSTVTARSFLALIYLIVFGSGGFAAYVWLLRVAPTPLVSTYAYVNPVVAVLLGHVLAAEPLAVPTVLAAALIVGSVALVSTTPESKKE